MLYAIFATLESLGQWDGVVIPIDPRRVGPFLLEDEMAMENTRKTRGTRRSTGEDSTRVKGSKENKKLKIALVGSWLRDGKGVVFEDGSESMRTAFLKRWLPKQRKTRADNPAELCADEVKDIEKLDDVADCLLQGVAWLKWEENKRRLVQGSAWGV
jgi:cruciform cutting endonuclease 1